MRDQDWHPDGPADIRGRQSDAQYRQENSGLPTGSGKGAARHRRAQHHADSGGGLTLILVF